jgi:hypothetical protein
MNIEMYGRGSLPKGPDTASASLSISVATMAFGKIKTEGGTKMHLYCFVCDNDNCQTHFAIQSWSSQGDPTCPNCGSEVTDTGEVIVDPRIMGISQASKEGRI